VDPFVTDPVVHVDPTGLAPPGVPQKDTAPVDPDPFVEDHHLLV
jgi:hypothetical protein